MILRMTGLIDDCDADSYRIVQPLVESDIEFSNKLAAEGYFVVPFVAPVETGYHRETEYWYINKKHRRAFEKLADDPCAINMMIRRLLFLCYQ